MFLISELPSPLWKGPKGLVRLAGQVGPMGLVGPGGAELGGRCGSGMGWAGVGGVEVVRAACRGAENNEHSDWAIQTKQTQ